MKVYETYVEVSRVGTYQEAAVAEVLGLAVPSEDGVLPAGATTLSVDGEVALDDDTTTDAWRRRTAIGLFAANMGPCRVHFEMTEKRVEPEMSETFDENRFAEMSSGYTCKFCERAILTGENKFQHDGSVVCTECYDERLRMTE